MTTRTSDTYLMLVKISNTLNEISGMMKTMMKESKSEKMKTLKESKDGIDTKVIPEDRKDPDLIVKKILSS